jgi:hypothetical protein
MILWVFPRNNSNKIFVVYMHLYETIVWIKRFVRFSFVQSECKLISIKTSDLRGNWNIFVQNPEVFV